MVPDSDLKVRSFRIESHVNLWSRPRKSMININCCYLRGEHSNRDCSTINGLFTRSHGASQIKLLAQEAAAVEEDDFDLAHDVKKLVDQLDVLEVTSSYEKSRAFETKWLGG